MHAKNIPIEREFTLDEALALGLKEISKFPYHFELNTIGSIYSASMCRLTLPSTGDIIIEACGKGGWTNSQVGAIYETIQDYCATHIDSTLFSDQAKIYYESSKIISNECNLQCDLVFNILQALPDQKIPCRYYTNIANDKKIMVPLFLSNVKIAGQHALNKDSVDYKILRRYSSDNGHAAGLTTQEALLHSINECIERDSFAVLLYQCFFRNNRKPLPIIDKLSIPQEQLINIKEIEAIIGCDVVLINMTTSTGVSSILCLATNEYFGGPLYGMGTSLYSCHAMERAVSEMMQLYWLQGINIKSQNRSKSMFESRYLRLNNYQKHLRCSKLDISDFLSKNYVSINQFSNLPTFINQKSPTDQMTYLKDKLNSLGLEIFYCQLMCSKDTGISVVHTIIPGLEYLWAAAFGQVVSPYKRLLAL